jgi:cyclase
MIKEMSLKNPYKKGGMFEGANYLLFERAKSLRKNMTASEMVLWMHIKEGLNGFKFRRQHPIGLYIADFYCHKAKLIIEVDGSIHDGVEIRQQDKIRQQDLENLGHKVIRFSNEQVLKQIEKVLQSITKTINEIIIIQTQNASLK